MHDRSLPARMCFTVCTQMGIDAGLAVMLLRRCCMTASSLQRARSSRQQQLRPRRSKQRHSRQVLRQPTSLLMLHRTPTAHAATKHSP